MSKNIRHKRYKRGGIVPRYTPGEMIISRKMQKYLFRKLLDSLKDAKEHKK